MALNDTVANALSKMNQYEELGRSECTISPSSRLITDILGILKKFKYIKGYNKVKDGQKESIVVQLTGAINECGVIKPRFSIKKEEFTRFEKRFLPSRDMGIIIISTVEGLTDHHKAKEKKIGGKLIAFCY